MSETIGQCFDDVEALVSSSELVSDKQTFIAELRKIFSDTLEKLISERNDKNLIN